MIQLKGNYQSYFVVKRWKPSVSSCSKKGIIFCLLCYTENTKQVINTKAKLLPKGDSDFLPPVISSLELRVSNKVRSGFQQLVFPDKLSTSSCTLIRLVTKFLTNMCVSCKISSICSNFAGILVITVTVVSRIFSANISTPQKAFRQNTLYFPYVEPN